jgi:cyanophycin synthetase
MEIQKTRIKDILLLTPKVFSDNRGFFFESFRENIFSEIGIDYNFVQENISKSIRETGGAVVEVNTAPGIRMHIYPSKGKSRDVAKDIIDMLFPDEESYKFPIVSVTGTNGKTTTVRLISHILAMTGRTVGMTSTCGTYIGEKCICKGDNSGPRSAKSLLSNKTIDAAVLETARGGIVRGGLGYNLADVGIITNVTNDHLGLDEIETMEDLAYAKALVVEAVKKDGAAVLNAEDKMTPFILERVRVKVILFSKNPELDLRFKTFDPIHVFTEDGWIKIKDKNQVINIIQIIDIPITCNGLIECNIDNSLAAVAGLYALHVPVDTIAAGLKSFNYNMGRFNIYEKDGYKVILDYGHNPAGYNEVVKACRKLGGERLITVMGMPGDRPDSSMREVGKLCASAFNKIYIKEDIDLRGRKSGETANIILNSIKETGYPDENVKIIENEVDALKAAVSDAKKGDLIVLLYEKIEPLMQYLDEIKAVKTDPVNFFKQ